MSDETTTPAGEPAGEPPEGPPDASDDASHSTTPAASDDSPAGGRVPRRAVLGVLVLLAVVAGAAVLLTGGDNSGPPGSDALRTRRSAKRPSPSATRPRTSTTRPSATTTSVALPIGVSGSTSTVTSRGSASGGKASPSPSAPGAGGGGTPVTVTATSTTVTTAALPPPAFTQLVVTSLGCGPSATTTLLQITYDTVNADKVTGYVNNQLEFVHTRDGSSAATTHFGPTVPCQSATYNVQLEATNARDDIAIVTRDYSISCYIDIFGARRCT